MSFIARFFILLITSCLFWMQNLYPENSSKRSYFFPIGKIQLEYTNDYPSLPSIDSLMKIQLNLQRTQDGYTTPLREAESEALSLEDFSSISPPALYSRTVLRLITRRIVEEINKLGVIGIYVYIDPSQIDHQGNDLREKGDVLRVFITASTVSSMATLKITPDQTSEDLEELAQERIEEPKGRIYQLSPVQVGLADNEGGTNNLIQKKLLEEYLLFLNRHPGRRVDLKIKPQGDAPEASIYFLILEGKPWRLAFNSANTAGESWSNQFDYVHYQFSDNDDILKLSFSTTDFKERHSISTSYEAPIPLSYRHRWELHWNRSEFGSFLEEFTPDTDREAFEGEQFSAGAKLIANLFHSKDFFTDALLDLSFKNIKVANNILLMKGKGLFYLPNFSLRFTRVKNTSTFFTSLGIEKNLFKLAKTKREELYKLGRGDNPEDSPKADPTIFRWSGSYSFYLEPMLNFKNWADTSTPESSTLAHEMVITSGGQFTKYRLVPQFKGVVGGAYTVRGYPQGAVSGDKSVTASCVYKFHFPRSLPLQKPDTLEGFSSDEERPFQWAPASVYGRPDWDLVLKAFWDFGYVNNITLSHKQTPSNEQSRYLQGVGVGVELMVKNYLQMRADWAFARTPLASLDIRPGYNRWHLSVSAAY